MIKEFWAPQSLVYWAFTVLMLFSQPLAAQEQVSRQRLEARLAKYYAPPAEFKNRFGGYRSPRRLEQDRKVESPEQWRERRSQIQQEWRDRLGSWPPLVQEPKMKKLESLERDGFVQHKIELQISHEGQSVQAYLLIPPGKGPFPAVVVPFYEPLTSIGLGKKGRGTHDYGLQLVRRGFVTLSLGTPSGLQSIGVEKSQLKIAPEKRKRPQPLAVLAYVAANCHQALARMPEVDPQRIGIIGLSYGGKWAMFASCLHDGFACAVWSDPGIVFNEKNANVNYWEPWYLGHDPKVRRKPGIPSSKNPRTGLYKKMIDAGDDLVDLHALMAPRPVLVSGGTEDPPANWQALNHLVDLNRMLGYENRVAMTARSGHIPSAEALELELNFLEYWLKPNN